MEKDDDTPIAWVQQHDADDKACVVVGTLGDHIANVRWHQMADVAEVLEPSSDQYPTDQ